MTTDASVTRSPLSPRSLLPLASICVPIGIAGALTMPFLALFLSDEVHASSAALGAFMLVSPLAGLIASTLIGRLSDSRAIRRNILVAGALAGALGAVVFAMVRDYWVLLAVSITLVAISSCLLAQMFAYTRQSLERGGNTSKASFGVSIMRTLISVAWVGGPPLAALLVSETGFEGLYFAAAALFLVVALMSARMPELGLQPRAERETGGGTVRRQIVFAAAGLVLLQGGSALGVNAMPLFITDVLHGTTGDAGLVLGLCAALEIPLILWFGSLATRFDQHRIVLLGGSFALLYHTGILLTGAVWHVAVVQVLSATAIAAVMGVGLTYFQSLAPDRPGFATTLYANTLTVGIMLSGPLLGLARELGFRTAYLMSLVLAALGVVSLFLGRTRRVTSD
nr:sugar efflux transporter [Kibdelosporangium sp. MJ126-NF4]CEL14355.1 Sugar efflux transporter B [Kibdelosporangium sp. MJ126-NF4]CTQ88721.1 Sugar efflux transporter B [Kibdelosporangium sp. MJ126-NF4]